MLANALAVVGTICPGSDATVEVVQAPQGIGGRRSPLVSSPSIAVRSAPSGPVRRSPAPQRSLDNELEEVSLSTPRGEAGVPTAAIYVV